MGVGLERLEQKLISDAEKQINKLDESTLNKEVLIMVTRIKELIEDAKTKKFNRRKIQCLALDLKALKDEGYF